MTLPLHLFTLITLGIIIMVLVFYNKRKTPFGIYVLLFLGLFLLAKFTIRSYLFPPQHIFGNHQYHFLEHQGFRVAGKEPVLLSSSRQPDKAIYNQYKGDLFINGSNGKYKITASRFDAPVYVAAQPGRGIKGMYFTLVNPPGTENVSTGFGVQKGEERLSCTIQSDGSRSRYIFTYNRGGSAPVTLTDTSSFRQTIKYGLPVMTLIRQTGLPVSDELEEQCEALLLVREKVYGNTDADNNSPLYLFPGDMTVLKNARFFNSNNQPVEPGARETHTADMAANQLFYIGFGQRAANNTDDAVWYMEDNAAGKQLKLLMPARFELPGNDSVLMQHKVLFVASGSNDVVDHNFGAGYLLPWFSDSASHQLHTLSYFSFTPGSARDSLLFSVVDMKAPENVGSITVRGNQPFYLKTGDRNVNWIFSFANLHEASFIQAKNMEGVLGLFIIGVLFLLLLVQKHFNTAKQFIQPETGQPVPRLELIIYIAVIPFLVLRLLILWRIGVFPPTKGIDYLQLADYLNREHFYQLIACGIIPFFIIRLIILLAQQLRLYNRFRKDAETFRQPLKQLFASIRFILLLLFAGIIISVVYAYLKLDVKYALFLLAVYIGAILISVLAFTKIKIISAFTLRKSTLQQLPPRMEKMMRGPLWQIIGKGLLSCFILFLAGGIAGYVLSKASGFLGQLQRFLNVFMPLCVFLYLYWRWLPGKHIYHSRFRQHFWLRVMAAAFTAGVLLISDSGFSIIFIFFCSIVFITELIYFYLNLSIGHKKIAFSGIVVLLALLLGFSYAITYAYKTGGIREVVNKVLGENNNIKYRALVQTSQEDKLAAGLYFKEEAFTRLQNASANKWFINYYLNQDHDHYFQLQPHMDFGVSYPVQTMDLLVLRYIIAEHGEWMVVLLLALLLTISFASGLGYRFNDGVSNANQYVAFAAGLLVFVIGFMVWLASTNRFIFFGQDFPLLSVQAKITTLLFFVFLLVMIANNRESKLKRGFETAGNISLHLFLFVTVIFFFLFTKKKESGAYNMAYVVQQVEDKCIQLNASFLSFQEELQERNRLPSGFRNILNEYKKSDDWAAISKQTEAEKDSLPFVYSVVNRLFQPNTDKYNPGQLMHVVRNTNGLYEFAVNRYYFQVKPPSAVQTDWKGSLVGAYSQKNIAVLYGQKDIPFNDSLPHVELLPQQTVAGIAYYPAGYLSDTTQQLVLFGGSRSNDGLKLVLNPGSNKAYAGNGVYRLTTSDWLQLVAKNGQRSNYFIREGQTQYLARSIWLNGNYRLFYPFGDRFIWPYNMGNAVAQAFSGTGKTTQDYITSLDYDLHNNNESGLLEFERAFKVVDSLKKIGKKQVVTVAVINGDGYVWDMQELDFNRHNQPSFNPNSSSDHFRFMRQLYMRRNASTERKVLGHQALLNMYNPGSTMKPFIYAATVSGNKLNWGSLQFVNKEKQKYVELEDKKLRVKYFAGRKLSHGFEHDINAAVVGPTEYLAQSKNMYHSMMVYLGSYTDRELDSGNLGRIMIPPVQPETKFENFPMFNYNGQTRVFNPDNPPRDETGKKYFGHNRAIIADKLWNNFSLATAKETFYNDSVMFNNLTNTDKQQLKQNTSYRQYALPEKSAFMQYMRKVDQFGDRNGLTNATVGAVVMQISPVKMAEMGARLFTVNRDLRVRLNRHDTGNYYKPFIPGRNYNGLNDLLNTYQQTLFTGMFRATQPGGTAVNLVSGIEGLPAGWYVYAKTGTADQENEKLRHKTLLVILSQVKMHEGELTAEMLKKNKVVCFYFSFFNHAGYDWQQADRSAIKKIISNTLRSASFSKYLAKP